MLARAFADLAWCLCLATSGCTPLQTQDAGEGGGGGGGEGGAGGSDAGVAGCDRPGNPYAESALEADIRFLAGPALQGRAAGSDGDRRARAYIESRMRCAGLRPVGGSYIQTFADSEGSNTANLIGVLDGSDAALASEIIVISAHHDHLGADRTGVFAGANDNASGVAALLAMAQALHDAGGLRRTVVFAAFASEEVGFDGSAWYTEHPPTGLPINKTQYNVNLDMVGRYDDEGVIYALNAFAGTPARSALNAVAGRFRGLEIEMNEPGDLSDQLSFCEVGVPGVFFHTPDNVCYHKTCDTPDRIDYPHLAQIAGLVGAVVTELANSEHGLAAARRVGCQP